MKDQEKRYVVPLGMIEAAQKFSYIEDHERRQNYAVPNLQMTAILHAAVKWLSENPIVPDKDTANRLIQCHGIHSQADAFAEWQRRMFLAPSPEPEVEQDDRLYHIEKRIKYLEQEMRFMREQRK
jgi:hypothetical protein